MNIIQQDDGSGKVLANGNKKCIKNLIQEENREERLTDYAYIPFDPKNIDYAEIRRGWNGNTWPSHHDEE